MNQTELATTDAEQTDQETGPGAARLEELQPGVHAWVQPDGSWFISNAGAVIGEEGVLVIDTCATAERTRRFLDAVDAAAGGAPIRIAVNTHQHGDHTFGNSLLPAATVLLGHTNMREGLRGDPIIDGPPPFFSPLPDWGPVERRLPDITVASACAVHVAGRRIEVLHPDGPAHTTGDLVAWLPGERVLFAGDLVFAGFTPLVFMGSAAGALAAIDWLASLEPSLVVPGHGPLLTGPDIEQVFDEHRRYYRFLLDLAEDGLSRGLTPLETMHAADLGEFSRWAEAERTVLNLHGIYADREHRQLDIGAAAADAVAWLGHPMHTHV